MRKTTHTRILAGAALLFLLLFVPEGAGAQRVYKSSLPHEVQESFRLAHPNLFPLKIVKWDWTSVGYCARYNFPYKEVMSLFQTNGEWVSTRRVVPEATLPLRAHDFISSKYAFYDLRSCAYEEDRWQGRHYYALFSIRGIQGYMTEICFDLQGNVVSIDGNADEDWDNFEPLNEEEVLLLQNHQNLSGEEVLSSVRGYREQSGDEEDEKKDKDKEEEDEVAEPSIGFFAWREDYTAMKQKKKEEREQKTSAFEEKWLSFLAKLKIKIYSEEEESEAQRQEEFQKEKDKQTKRLYKPQSRRDFSYAQVMVQTKTAQMKQDSEDEQTVMPVEETIEPIEEFTGPVEEAIEEIMEPVEESVEEAIEEITEPVEESVEEAIEEITEPVEEIVELAENIEEPVEEATEEITEKPTPVVRTESMQSSLVAANVPALTITAKTLFPENIQQAFEKRFPKAERVKYYHDTNTDYRAVFTNFGQKAEAVFLQDGTHITTALFFGSKDISYPIRQYIESQPNKPKFVTGKRVVYESRYRQGFATAAEKPQNYYEVVVWEKNKQDKSRDYYLLRFDHKGHFVSSTPYDYVGSR